MKILSTLSFAIIIVLSGCAKGYELVPPGPVKVAKGSMGVRPGIAWNKAPKSPYDVPWEENWTENGSLLDDIEFIGGLPDGQAITKQRRKEDRKVPVFHANMSPQDIASMLETFYRIKAGASIFETRSLEPTTFLGVSALRFDYDYVGGDEVKRRGRTVVAILSKKLYFISLDAARLHYFDAALPEFDAIVASARVK